MNLQDPGLLTTLFYKVDSYLYMRSWEHPQQVLRFLADFVSPKI